MIDIHIEYKQMLYTIPINPEKLKIEGSSGNKTEESLGLGEINIIKARKLKEIEIESFVVGKEEAKKLIDFIGTIRLEKKPCRFIATDLDINILVSIEDFENETRAGEEEDIYYTLGLKEWVDYSPKRVVVQTSPQQPVKVETPRVDNKKPSPKAYTVVSGDSLWKISKRMTGNGNKWGELYNLNKKVIGSNPNRIYPKQVLNIPKGW